MKTMKGMRWWMVGLVTLGLIVNHLARNTLSVAAPTMMADPRIDTKEYSYIVVAWTLSRDGGPRAPAETDAPAVAGIR